ncbi:hypothetical protein L218DRAFT_964697 [Marasmius fiardii PR-910]|nr:hypothetical protein L218DRAFT_964697 [Marasmius fiardii PR-910]
MTSQSPFSSPFQRHLGTNYVPNPKEIVQLKEILLGPQKTLDRLTDEISRLESTLQTLTSQRNAIQAYIDQHRALLSPFRHLPTDIVREIFIQSLPTDHCPTRSLFQAPLVLTIVCKVWREIALTTPHLWRAIHIYIPQLMAESDLDSHVSLIQARAEGVKNWLERSGSLPIRFSLVVDTRPLFYHRRAAQAIGGPGVPGVVRTRETRVEKNVALMEVLLQYAPRWELVCLRLPLVLISRFGALLSGKSSPYSLPGLKTLRVAFSLPDSAFGDDPRDGTTHILSRVLQAAPSLRSLHLINDLHHDLSHLPIVWANLTELALHLANGLSASRAVDILARTSQMLRKCSMIVYVPDSNGGFTGSTSYVELPRLEVLQLTFITLWRHQPAAEAASDELGGLLNHIYGPSLTHLCITASLSERLSQVPFIDFVNRSSCQLKALEIQFPLSDKALERCLRLPACSSLSSLVVNEIPTKPVGFSRSVQDLSLDPTVSSGLLTALMIQSTLCPLLEQVIFKNCISRDVRGMIDFIECRSRPCDGGRRKLRYVAVSFAYDVGNDHLPEIEVLRREGVQIVWTYEKRRRAGDSPDEGLVVPAVGQEGSRLHEVDREWL